MSQHLTSQNTLSEIKEKLNGIEKRKLDKILEYLYRNGVDEYLRGDLLPHSVHLKSQKSIGILPGHILDEYVSSLSSMKSLDKLKQRIDAGHKRIHDMEVATNRASNQRREERKRTYGEMIAENTDANLLPPHGRVYLRAKRSFESASAKQSSSHKGGRKTRRQRRRQTGR
jgi:hypothetical protein